jgi:hypothetical protein
MGPVVPRESDKTKNTILLEITMVIDQNHKKYLIQAWADKNEELGNVVVYGEMEQ